MAGLSALRGDGDVQVGELRAPAVVPERASDGASAAASVSRVRADVFGRVGVARARRVVRAGGPSERDRPLAASGDIDASDGGGAAVVVGTPGAVAGLAAAGPGPHGRAGLSSEREHGRALAGPGRADG